MNLDTIQLEKHFETMLHDAARRDGCHVVPLPDDCKIGLAAGNASCKAKQKPYDFGLVYGGQYMAVECKLVKGKVLQGSKIEQHQHEGLMEAMKAGAYGVLAIFFMFKEGTRARRATFFIDYSSACLDEDFVPLDKPPSFSYDSLVKDSKALGINQQAFDLPHNYDIADYWPGVVQDYFKEMKRRFR